MSDVNWMRTNLVTRPGWTTAPDGTRLYESALEIGVADLMQVLGVPADLLDLELTHIQLADGSWIPKPRGCE